MSSRCLSLPSLAAASLIALLAMGAATLAATGASKDDAVAMVKQAVTAINTEGPDNEISKPTGKFVDRDLYIVVYGLDGMVLAHGADAKRIGTNQLADKDPDGKAFVKERVELAATQPSFWQTYKFINPVTHKVEPKEMYCERLEQTVVCGGVYQL